MIAELLVTTIANAIRLTNPPVLLLTGVASMLSVLTNSLGRNLDKSRLLHGRSVSAVETDRAIQVEII